MISIVSGVESYEQMSPDRCTEEMENSSIYFAVAKRNMHKLKPNPLQITDALEKVESGEP